MSTPPKVERNGYSTIGFLTFSTIDSQEDRTNSGLRPTAFNIAKMTIALSELLPYPSLRVISAGVIAESGIETNEGPAERIFFVT